MLVDSPSLIRSSIPHSNPARGMTLLDFDSREESLQFVNASKESLAASPEAASLTRSFVDLALELYVGAYSTGQLNFPFASRALSAVIDISRVREHETVDFEPSSTVIRKLFHGLSNSYASDPIEDGVDHPSEVMIEEALNSSENPAVLQLLQRIALNKDKPYFSSSVLRSLCRISQPGTSSWRRDLIRSALLIDDVQIRDAAIQAAEHWGGSAISKVLSQHEEPVPWLRQYADDVLRDLSV